MPGLLVCSQPTLTAPKEKHIAPRTNLSVLPGLGVSPRGLIMAIQGLIMASNKMAIQVKYS